MILEIGFQIVAAVFAGENVLQPGYERAVVVLVCRGGMHRIVEAHGVQKVPHGRTPHGR